MSNICDLPTVSVGLAFDAAGAGEPSLWTWQQATEAFLLHWCPPGKKNAFKWKDSTREDGNWTLTAEECKQIAYVTTYQYAHVLLQHDAIASM